jgi:hypothetical protein
MKEYAGDAHEPPAVTSRLLAAETRTSRATEKENRAGD